MAFSWITFGILSALTAATSVIQMQMQRRQQEAALRRVEEARARNVQVSGSGAPARVLLGRGIVHGMPIYAELGDRLPLVPDAGIVAGTMRPRMTRKRALILIQWANSAGNLSAAPVDVWDAVDDESFKQGSLAAQSIIEIAAHEAASAIATAFTGGWIEDAEFLRKGKLRTGRINGTGSNQRTDQDVGAGLTFATGVFLVTKDELIGERDRVFDIAPRPLFFYDAGIEGRRLDADGLTDGGPGRNLAEKYLTALTQEIDGSGLPRFGPGVPISRVDQASYARAGRLCGLKVQGPDNDLVTRPNPLSGSGETYGQRFASLGYLAPGGAYLPGIAPNATFPTPDAANAIELVQRDFTGSIDTDRPHGEMLADIVAHEPHVRPFRGLDGLHKMAVIDWQTPLAEQSVATVTDADVVDLEDEQWTLPDDTLRLNSATIKFADVELSNAESSATFPDPNSALGRQLVAEDNGARLHRDFSFPAVDNVHHARATAWQLVMESRRWDVATKLRRPHFKLEPGDIVLRQSELFDRQAYFVVETRALELPSLVSSLGLKEIRQADAAWIVDDRQDVPAAALGILPSAAPINMAAAISNERRVSLTWEAGEGEVAITTGYEVQEEQGGAWRDLAATGSTLGYDFDAGTRAGSHRYRARPVGIGGYAGPWSDAAELSIPADPANLPPLQGTDFAYGQRIHSGAPDGQGEWRAELAGVEVDDVLADEFDTLRLSSLDADGGTTRDYMADLVETVDRLLIYWDDAGWVWVRIDNVNLSSTLETALAVRKLKVVGATEPEKPARMDFSRRLEGAAYATYAVPMYRSLEFSVVRKPDGTHSVIGERGDDGLVHRPTRIEFRRDRSLLGYAEEEVTLDPDTLELAFTGVKSKRSANVSRKVLTSTAVEVAVQYETAEQGAVSIALWRLLDVPSGLGWAGEWEEERSYRAGVFVTVSALHADYQCVRDHTSAAATKPTANESDGWVKVWHKYSVGGDNVPTISSVSGLKASFAGGAAVSLTARAENGDQPVSWAWKPGAAIAWLAASTVDDPDDASKPKAGRFAGTAPSPNARTDYVGTIRVTDNDGSTDDREVTVTVRGPAALAWDGLPARITATADNQSYDEDFVGPTGGTPPYTVTEANLPGTVTGSLAGGKYTLAGALPAEGEYESSHTVADSANPAASVVKRIEWDINRADDPAGPGQPVNASLRPTSGRTDRLNFSYSLPVGGTPAVRFEVRLGSGAWVDGGAVKPGVTRYHHQYRGLVANTRYTAQVRCVDAGNVRGAIVSRTATTNATTNKIPRFKAEAQDQTATAGHEFSYSFPEAEGGDGALAYQITGAPSWCSVNGRHIEASIPSAPAAAVKVICTVTDADGDADTTSMRLNVQGAATPVTIEITEKTLGSGPFYVTHGGELDFDAVVTPVGKSRNRQWSASAGSIATGGHFTAPAAPQNQTLAVTVTFSCTVDGAAHSESVTVTVIGPINILP